MLVPKRKVPIALKAIRELEPRWGKLLLQSSKYAASRRGIHTPDPCDASTDALRAIELPAPLDEKLSNAVNGHARAPDDAAALVPQELLDLLATGGASLDLEFEAPIDLDDLYPCPAPEPGWDMSSSPPLPAQASEDGGWAEAFDGLRSCPGGASASACPAAHACPGAGPFRFVELFAGIGGFRVGLEALGGSCVFASELHPTAQAVYRENFRDEAALLAGDIRIDRKSVV